MNLEKKKRLAAKTLNVGLGRIKFDESRLNEIKEAITKQDIRELHNDGAIIIKEIHGRKKVEKHGRRGPGNVRKKVKNSKRKYIIITRKLRKYLKEMKGQKKLEDKKYQELRRHLKMNKFKSKRQLKEHIGI